MFYICIFVRWFVCALIPCILVRVRVDVLHDAMRASFVLYMIVYAFGFCGSEYVCVTVLILPMLVCVRVHSAYVGTCVLTGVPVPQLRPSAPPLRP